MTRSKIKGNEAKLLWCLVFTNKGVVACDCDNIMESDSESFNGNERVALLEAEEEEDASLAGSDDDSTVGGNVDIDPAAQAFNNLLLRLHNESPTMLLSSAHEIILALLNVDELCSFLSETGPVRIGLGTHCAEERRLGITEYSAPLWNKLLETMESIATLEYMSIGCGTFAPELASRLVQSAPQSCLVVDVRLPLYTESEEDMSPLAHALPLHRGVRIDLVHDNAARVQGGHRLALNEGILFQLGHVVRLKLVGLQLSADECHELRAILALDTLSITEVELIQCSFLDGAEKIFLEMFANLTTLTTIMLYNSFQLCNELPAFVVRNHSITNICIGSFYAVDFDVVELITEISQNKAIETLYLRGFKLTMTDRLKLQEAFKKNFTIKLISIDSEQPFREITTLNMAGRQYLASDEHPHDNSRCIAVLAKVKHDLDCLYSHLRENPILCITAASQN